MSKYADGSLLGWLESKGWYWSDSTAVALHVVLTARCHHFDIIILCSK